MPASQNAAQRAARSSAAPHIGADLRRGLAKWGSLTTAQEKLVLKLQVDVAEAAECEAADAERTWIDVPESDERVTVAGEILHIRIEDSQFGYNRQTVKMLTRIDTPAGCYKLWGSMPAAIQSADKGAHITFSAKVERSLKDSGFGFYKRPTKAAIVEEAVAS